MKEPEKIFNQLYEEAKKDPNIIGFFLSGSRAKDFVTKHSDYDIYIIIKNSKIKQYKKKYSKIKHNDIDLIIFSLKEFKEDGNWEKERWARYNFAHLKVLIDKNTKIQKMVNEKARVPKEHVRPFIRGSLDAYINYVYRSLKCWRDGDPVAARLEAAYSIPLFFDVIFALNNGRLRPYYKYLQWELKKFPLKKIPMTSGEIIRSIMKIMNNADVKTQQRLLKMCEKVFRREGYGKVFDEWGYKLHWMKTFKK